MWLFQAQNQYIQKIQDECEETKKEKDELERRIKITEEKWKQSESALKEKIQQENEKIAVKLTEGDREPFAPLDREKSRKVSPVQRSLNR